MVLYLNLYDFALLEDFFLVISFDRFLLCDKKEYEMHQKTYAPARGNDGCDFEIFSIPTHVRRNIAYPDAQQIGREMESESYIVNLVFCFIFSSEMPT